MFLVRINVIRLRMGAILSRAFLEDSLNSIILSHNCHICYIIFLCK
jgi:hypothetical protein